MKYGFTHVFAVGMGCALIWCASCSPAASGCKPDVKASTPSDPGAGWIPWLGKNGKYGYADRQGTVRIQPRYADAKPFAFGRAPVSDGSTKGWGFIDAEQRWLVKPSFTELDNGQPAQGAIRIPRKSVGSFPLTFTLRKAVDEYYFIDEDNRVLPAREARAAFSPPEAVRRSALEMDARLLVMDDRSRFFFYLPHTEDGAGEKPRAGIMDREGNILAPPVYTVTYDIHTWSAARNAPMLIQQGDRYGYIAPDGTLLVPPRFTDAGTFWCGYAPVAEGGLWGLLDAYGKPAAPFMFSRIRHIFLSGLIQAEYKGKNILWDIGTQKQWVVDIPPKGGPGPDFPGHFSASVVGCDTPGNVTDAWVLISFPAYTGYPGVDVYTREGAFLGTYESTLNSGASRLWLQDGTGKWGALDMAGRTAIPFVYDYARRTSLEEEDIVRVERDGQYFYVDAAGREYREK